MIKLLNNLVADYAFTGSSVAPSNHDVIFIGELAGLAFTEDSCPVATFATLDGAIAEMGGLEPLLMLAVNRDRTTYLILKEEEVTLLLAYFFRSLYPNIGFEMFHRLIKLTVVDQKYGQTNRPSRLFTIKSDKMKLVIPTTKVTRVLYEKTANVEKFSATICRELGIEYLLAHSLAVDFDETDELVMRFTQDLNDILWGTLVADYNKRKRKLTMGIFNWPSALGIDIDPLADDFDERIKDIDSHLLFKGAMQAEDMPRTKENTDLILGAVNKVNALNGIDDNFKEVLAQFFASEQSLSVGEVKELVYQDKQRQWSALFGRNKILRGINSLFTSYLFTADPRRLSRLSLN